MHVFLSHNWKDKDIARRLGAQFRLAGADVWFDEWEVRAGDSIPGKVNEGLGAVDTVVLLGRTTPISRDGSALNLRPPSLRESMPKHLLLSA